MSLCYLYKNKIEFLAAVWRIDWRRTRMEAGKPIKWSRGEMMMPRANMAGMEEERTGCICKVSETESTGLPEVLNIGGEKMRGTKCNF